MPDLNDVQFNTERTVSPLAYGIPVAVDARGPGSLKGVLDGGPRPYEVREVPLDQLRATQGHISPDHAARIAQTPKTKMDARKKMASGYDNPADGTVWIEDGHHRAAGAALRGDETLRTQIKGTVAPQYQGVAGRAINGAEDVSMKLKGGSRA